MIVDLFAGPGGWDVGAASIGRTDVVGLEWDDAACRTAKAAGHARIRCDVAAYPTNAFGMVEGLLGSPSCTLFSSAGTGVGRLVLDLLAKGIVDMLHGNDTRQAVRDAIYPVTLAEAEAKNAKRKPAKRWTQERVEEKARSDAFVAALVIEPARYIVGVNPEWIALEQVPEVLPLWQVYVRELRRLGYSAWTGVLNAANYGVPQTRERAIVMASRIQTVAPPAPTHAQAPQGVDLFGGELSPWVSMAEALGWGFPEPSCTVSAGGGDTGGPEPFANAGYRKRLAEYVVDRRTNSKAAGGGMAPTVPVSVQRPAPTFTGKSGEQWVIRMGNQANSAVRTQDEPSPTVVFGARSNKVEWFHTRPATTVVGSYCPDVISAPGYRLSESRQNAEGGVRVTVAEGGVRVTVAEGGVLQSFPADYPWQGSRTKQYQQVGNAIPPVLAAHVLAALGVAFASEVAA